MSVDIQFNLLQSILLWAIPLLFAITIHEAAHGYVANKLGDPTAKMLGRLTLNPLKHIDLFGTLILPTLTVWLGGFIFGWAKPVPITWRNFKNARWDMAWVALAGPMANFCMAIVWAGISKSGEVLQAHQIISGVALEAMGKIGVYTNSILMILNLLPIQPLDGGRIVSCLLLGRVRYYFDRLEPYGIIILLFLLVTHVLTFLISVPLSLIVTFIRGMFGI